MIRFTCDASFADRCSWQPTREGVVFTVWHSESADGEARILISAKALETLLKMHTLAKESQLTETHAPEEDPPAPPNGKGGDK